MAAEATFDSPVSYEETVALLEQAIARAAQASRRLSSRPLLGGSVEPPRVRLHRDRGGRNWYLEFEGEIVEAGNAAIIQGQFIRRPSVVLIIGVPFLVLWGALVAGASVINWRGADSAVFLVGGLVAFAIAAGIVYLRSLNVNAERRFLADDIRATLRPRDV